MIPEGNPSIGRAPAIGPTNPTKAIQGAHKVAAWAAAPARHDHAFGAASAHAHPQRNVAIGNWPSATALFALEIVGPRPA